MVSREFDFGTKSIHEAIELQVKKEGHKPKPVKPLEAPVLAQGHTAIYRMHRYWARRPHNVFSKLIEHYSNPGDLILDPFCGGGVTAVEALKLRRKVVAIDVNPLATWITKVQVEPINLDEFERLFSVWHKSVVEKIRQLFRAKCPKCGGSGVAEWFEWSNVVICPHCEKEVVLGTAKKLRPGLFECQNNRCKARIEPNKCERLPDNMLNVLVNCEKCKKSSLRTVKSEDIKNYEEVLKSEKRYIKKEKLELPNDEFPDMDRARDDNIFGKGIKYFKDLMTVRQRLAVGLLKTSIPNTEISEAMQNALYHTFSGVLRYTNKFVFQSPGWQSGKPIEWAGHNYWLPFAFFELNPLEPLRKRFNAMNTGKTEQNRDIGSFWSFPKTSKPWQELKNGATCWILTQSSHSIKLPDSSVDAIITDPPFGGNVQYGELSDFYLVWLKDYLNLGGLSDKTQEAIETRNQGFEGAKDRSFYETMLYKVFKECRRVIKPNGWMVMTFHNRDIGVWMSLHRAALRAGFRLPSETESSNRGMIYQPPVQNYTQTIHSRAAGSMLGDFILSFKPVEAPVQLEAIKSELTTEEEKRLQNKAEEIIRYHGGADDTTLMTGLVPYLYEQALLHRIARYDLRLLLQNGPFVYVNKEKKWFMKDMVEESGALKPIDTIEAEVLVQNLVHNHLSEHKQATMDQLLVTIYTNLVNAHRPQINTIDRVINKYCKKTKVKGQNREIYIWNPKAKTPEEIKKILEAQTKIPFETPARLDHNTIIELMAKEAISKRFEVHVGETEQRKSPILKALSLKLSGLELGLPPRAFRFIKEIDLIIFKYGTILAALEVATTLSTFNKAVNDRFRNLLSIVPNLNVKLGAIVSDEDFLKAQAELRSVANIKSGLSEKVRLHRVSDIAQKGFLDKIVV